MPTVDWVMVKSGVSIKGWHFGSLYVQLVCRRTSPYLAVWNINIHDLCITDVPQLKALWQSYHDIYTVDTLLVPTTPITARPIDDVEPYVTINGRKVPH